MAQYVQMPKDLNKVKDKFMFGLTKRQIAFFSIGLLFGGLAYYLTYKTIGVSTAGGLLFMLASPWFIMGMYEKNGFTLDRKLINFINYRFIRPRVRVYETENIYSSIEEQIQIDEEMKMLETGKKPVTKKAVGKGKKH